jgi:outer membrane protein assembly factor BamA
MQPGHMTIILIASLVAPWIAIAEDLPAAEVIEAQGAEIGAIEIERQDVFDLSDPEENNWLFRLANRLHIITREKVIRKQLLIVSGEDYSKRLADETERILRQNGYLHDAKITPVRYENGVVDLRVTTRDLWSLQPELSLSRSGGENSTKIGLEEANLFGRGQKIRIMNDKDVDRESRIFQFSDNHLGRSWVSAFLHIADNSDGHSNQLKAIRPFYQLDARWTAGTILYDDDRREALYELGNEAAEYQHERDYYSAFYGWSKGLRNGRARRWTAGFVYDDNRFAEVVNGTLPAKIPPDRKLVYPFLGFESVEDQFETSVNRDQINQTEDFMMGTRVSAVLGWSDTSMGADRDALLYSGAISRGFGNAREDSLLLSTSIQGRLESGKATNQLVNIEATYYQKQSEKRLFFASIEGTAGHALDVDNPVRLGGDTGLRGYPLRYQNGESKLLTTIEQRYYTDWYPFRIIRVGGAVFADVGRVWGPSPVGEERLGWLTDVGFGLRLALTRSSSRKVIHIDLAFPLNGDSSIDSVQFLVESRRSF